MLDYKSDTTDKSINNKEILNVGGKDQKNKMAMISINKIDIENTDYYDEVCVLLKEAQKYLLGFKWCNEIEKGWLVENFGYILNIYLFKILPDKKTCFDEYIWIVVGDIPPAYIDIISAKNAYEALETYIIVMQEWVNNVYQCKSVDDCFPINVPPHKEYADMLNSRLKSLERDFLPLIKNTITLF